MNTTAIIITAIICTTLVLLSLISRGSRGNGGYQPKGHGQHGEPPKGGSSISKEDKE